MSFKLHNDGDTFNFYYYSSVDYAADAGKRSEKKEQSRRIMDFFNRINKASKPAFPHWTKETVARLISSGDVEVVKENKKK